MGIFHHKQPLRRQGSERTLHGSNFDQVQVEDGGPVLSNIAATDSSLALHVPRTRDYTRKSEVATQACVCVFVLAWRWGWMLVRPRKSQGMCDVLHTRRTLKLLTVLCVLSFDDSGGHNVHTYIYIYICHICIYIYTCIYMYKYMYAYRLCMYFHTHTYTYIYVYMCVCMSKLGVLNKKFDAVNIYFLELVTEGIGSATPFLLLALRLLVRVLFWALQAALLRHLFSKQAYTHTIFWVSMCVSTNRQTKK